MVNKKYGHEWIELAVKHLSTAQVLFDANHYTDIIGIELQQSIERYLTCIIHKNMNNARFAPIRFLGNYRD